MSDQAVIVYISQAGGEIDDLNELVHGLEVELDWVGTLNGQDIPVKIRLSEVDPEDEWPEETEHDYAEYDTPEILRDHLVEHHGFLPASVRVLFEAGGHHLDTAHQMVHSQPIEDGPTSEHAWPEHDTAPCTERGEHIGTQRHPRAECPTYDAGLEDDLRIIRKHNDDEEH